MRTWNTVEPAYLREVAKDSSVNEREFASALQVCRTTFRQLRSEGIIPPPDWRGGNGTYGTEVKLRSNQWLVSTVRRWFRTAQKDMIKTPNER